MLLIIRSECPELLTKNKAQWTAPWVAHYRWQSNGSVDQERPKKPTDNHWLKDEVRLLLIRDFHNNCGYCGESLPTPQGILASKGDVDHFLPKSIKPELVYEWTNYIWSCKPCNELKNEFYSVNYPLLNPCYAEDCAMLVFIEDTGRYVLQNTVANNNSWPERFKNSEQKTMLNADEVCQNRRLKISMLRNRFTSVAYYLDMIHPLPAISNSFQEFIDRDITEILEVVNNTPDFHFLLKEHYQLLRQKYPQVAELLG